MQRLSERCHDLSDIWTLKRRKVQKIDAEYAPYRTFRRCPLGYTKTEFLLLHRRRRSCLDSWLHGALVRARRRSRTRSRRRMHWFVVLVAGLLFPPHPPIFTAVFKRNPNAQHRNPMPDEIFASQQPQGTSWTRQLSRATVGRKNSSKVAQIVVRENRDYRGRPAYDPLQPDRQNRPRLRRDQEIYAGSRRTRS